MMYKAYLIQSGDGCDYTIGCARTVIDVEATSLEEAKTKLRDIIVEEYVDERELKSAELYEINSVNNLDLNLLYDDLKERETKAILQVKEENEKAEFERLKKKYE